MVVPPIPVQAQQALNTPQAEQRLNEKRYE